MYLLSSVYLNEHKTVGFCFIASDHLIILLILQVLLAKPLFLDLNTFSGSPSSLLMFLITPLGGITHGFEGLL